MLHEVRGYIRSDAWFGLCLGVLLILIVLALNATADTLGRLVDPRSATRGVRAAL
jgi:ABC-type dipeptide/oligopeptide/nickel transport system permease subunit